MTPYLIYVLATGEILETGYAPVEILEQLPQPGQGVVQGQGTLYGHYVDPASQAVIARGTCTARPYMTSGKVGEPSQIINLPAGVRVTVRNPAGVVVALPEIDELDIAAYIPTAPGRHTWEVRAPRLLPLDCVFDVAE